MQFKKILLYFYLVLYTVSCNFTTIYANENVLEPVDNTVTQNLSLKNSNNLNILSDTALLYDPDRKIVLYEKNGYEKRYPASITKVMTALLTLEYANGNLDDTVTFSRDAVYSIPSNSSHIAMNEGETLTVEESLYGLLLASANEVANALAEYVSGSVEDFGVLMTNRAKELGAKNTNFVNPHGLHDDNHYTTAYDMALIMSEAIKNEDFNRISGTYHYTIEPTEKQPEPRELYNSNRMIRESSEYYYEDVVSGKTGFTDEAQHTLVTYASRDGVNLIAVVLNGQRYEPYIDSKTLYDYGFSLYNDMTIYEGSNEYDTLDIKDGDNVIDSISVSVDPVTIKLPTDVGVNLEQVPRYEDLSEKNVNIGDTVGSLDFLYEGNVVYTAPIVSNDNFNYDAYLAKKVAKENRINLVKTIFKVILTIIFIIFAFITSILFIRRYNIKKRRRYNKIYRGNKRKNTLKQPNKRRRRK